MDSSTSIPGDADSRRLVLFRLAGRTYGIELGSVREILPCRRATRLPGAPPWVAGLLNIRGTIVTVIDLGARLHDVAAAREGGSVMLVAYGGTVVGLAVDDVLDIRRAAEVPCDVPAAAPGFGAPPPGVSVLPVHDVLSTLLA